MRRREKRWPVPFLDLSNTLFFFFVAMFAMTLMVISDAEENKKVDVVSRYLVMLSWPDSSNSDVDLSVKLPTNDVVWFRHRQIGGVSLDNDDQGYGLSSVVTSDGQTVVVPNRAEVIYLKSVMAGTFVVNTHLYAMRDAGPVEVTVTVVSIEPHWQELAKRKITLTENHEEHTAIRITFDPDGNFIGRDEIEELFVNDLLNGNAP